ncbi:Transglutaminase-like superfamily protein [Dyella sp. OK004]|uniref:transglutaminase-like domain-containing protein n=1 Tax=Dyella sp. OK004 TaxID=1855292 RepID=UPI0008EF2F83|nr:transglutaminase-like domain-containing protein [Dyella sp. OK004]SFS19794.1 Transglutaminase-like superfamily protein [Dyella sp. OK004]
MRRLIAMLLLVLLLCPVPWAVASTAAPTVDTTWMSVLLGGRKIGHLKIDRESGQGMVTTTQTLSIMLNRTGRSIPLSNMIRSVESTDGEPLAFASRTSMSAMDSVIDGQRQSDGSYKVTTTVGGATRESSLYWPAGALLNDGQRRAMLAASRQPGLQYQLQMFDPASQQVMDVAIEVIGNEQVKLPGGTEMLNHQRQRLHQTRGDQILDLWLDDHGQARKGIISMLGRQLEMLACDQTCAMAPVQDVDMFRAAMVDAPRPLTPNLRESFLRYRVRIEGSGSSQPIINTDEQRVRRLADNEWQIDIGPAYAGGQRPPQPEDLQANSWLQSDAPAIRDLARQAVGSATSNRQKIRRLRSFVSHYITQHGLDVGYASALEVVGTRQGDCTEYSVLLAAMARAEGIPARVVTGMVYADRYANTSRVFVPHAWVQAWIDGRWQSYDAALRRFDSTHIALDSGDGDPWHFFSATDLFSSMQIEDVMPSWEFMSPAPAGAVAPPALGGNGGG